MQSRQQPANNFPVLIQDWLRQQAREAVCTASKAALQNVVPCPSGTLLGGSPWRQGPGTLRNEIGEAEWSVSLLLKCFLCSWLKNCSLFLFSILPARALTPMEWGEHGAWLSPVPCQGGLDLGCCCPCSPAPANQAQIRGAP